MSVESMCVGDTLVHCRIADPGFGRTPTASVVATLEGRIDTFSASEDRRAGKPDEVRSLMGYFSSNPGLSVGDYCKWTETESGAIVFSPPKALRVTGAYHEGRPGKTLLWVVSFAELTATAALEILPS